MTSLGRAVGRLAKQVWRQRAGEVPSDQARIAALPGLVSEGPRSAYELVTRRALEDLAKDFERVETKVNGVIFGVLLTFILEVWKSFR